MTAQLKPQIKEKNDRMTSVKTNFMVGIFVTIGLAISMAAVIWLGMSHYFEKGKNYVIYFDESVQGLGVDSPVKYRGVSIGRVENIRVAPDANLIQVIIKIERSITNINQIVGRLKSVGITGIMFVELEKKQRGEPDLSPKINFPTQYPVIASRPSEIKQFFTGINDLLTQIKSIDVGGISKGIKQLLTKIGRTLDDAQIKPLAADLRNTLTHIRNMTKPQRWDPIISNIDQETTLLITTTKQAQTTFNNINKVITDNQENINNSLDDFRRSLKTIASMTQEGSHLIQQTDQSIQQFKKDVRVIIQNLEKTSRHIDTLTDALSDYPAQIIMAEPPTEKVIEPEQPLAGETP